MAYRQPAHAWRGGLHRSIRTGAVKSAPTFLKQQIAANAIIMPGVGAVVTWLTFRERAVLEFGGQGNVAFDHMISTVAPIFLITILLTRGIRRRVAARGLEAMSGAVPWPLPHRLWARATVLAAAGGLVFGMLGLVVLALLLAPDTGLALLLAFKVAYHLLLAVTVVPIIVVAALRDRVPSFGRHPAIN